MSDWREMLTADVLTLGMAADEARRALPGGNVVTYTRVHVVTDSEVRAATPIPAAASEVRLFETPETLEAAVECVGRLRALAGTRRVSAFSMADIERRSWSNARGLVQLVGGGLDDVAELAIDQVIDVQASIEALRTAGARPRRLSVLHPLGDRRTETIASVQRALAAVGGGLRVAPLPRIAPVDKPTTGYDDLRMIALSRLALGDASIEVDWTLYGPKLAQVALTFGADHLDGVPSIDDPALGRRRATVEDVERNIKAAGFVPQEFRASRAIA
jgi:aminodeoxyfutalosine synthase